MWRNILCQSAFQLAITLFLVYSAEDTFGIDLAYLNERGYHATFEDTDVVGDYIGTFVFNTFVAAQVRRRGQPACLVTHPRHGAAC
jgi:hypothetical protein